jgi:hypothetical protein
MGSLTRGPLPSSVYWRRRLILLTVSLVLLIGIARFLGGGSDGRSDSSAATVSTSTRPTVTVTVSPTTVSSAPALPGVPGRHTAPVVPTTTAPPTPTGDCAPADIVAVPTVTGAYAGSPVTVALQLRTRTTPACTWRVTRDAVQVRISRGGLRVWSTALCPQAVPAADLVVRRDTTTTLALTWDGHRSDQSCSVHTPWAPPGRYSIVAAALGGEPGEAGFTLARPTIGGTSPSTSPSATTSSTPGTSPSASSSR